MKTNPLFPTSILAVILFFILSSSFAQQFESGIAHYVVKPIKNQEKDGRNDPIKALEPFSDQISASFLFELTFNEGLSQFVIVETDALRKFSEKSLKLSVVQFGYADTVWQDNAGIYSKSFEGFSEREPILIDESIPNGSWKITKEKKEIDQFTCYKATRTAVIKRGSKTFSTPIIAWFCPDIPVHFGPLDFGGLPGLILEAQTDKYLYGLKSIKFGKFPIAAIPTYPKFTEEQLIERLTKNPEN